ncbi:MAG TPA: ribonuclease P protein component [Anaerolineales bacterium]|nr:ribonuclease P protein component [Anaerolineales bacterium]
MQHKYRLTHSDEFKRVRRNGTSYAHPLVVLIAQASEQQSLRVGVTAGRTVGNAVQRNRAKRLLREAIRSMLPSLASGWDLVLVARSGMVNASLEDTRAALATLLHRAGLTPLDES